MLKILVYCFAIYAVIAETTFGTSYLKNSKLCQPWSCINSKLGLPDGLPPKEQFAATLSSLLPEGAWQDVAEKVVHQCYEDRPRRYTNTCPGQSLFHCTVDQLIQFCPVESLRKDDACAPLTSLAGFKYMFAQSRYENFDKNTPNDRRPSWFLKNYFNSKCCNLPDVNSTALAECGFSSFIQYYVHETRSEHVKYHIDRINSHPSLTTNQRERTAEKVKVVDINENTVDSSPSKTTSKEGLTIVDIEDSSIDFNLDALGCCDLNGFVEASWMSECGFQLTWDERQRLSMKNMTRPAPVVTSTVPTTTARPVFRDVKVIPQACEKQTCVFRKLNIVSENGSVDLDAFSKLLDNMTNEHNQWTKAKARVVTKCLTKPLKEYTDECEINRVLACTFDIMSESCPFAQKHDPCKHSKRLKEDLTCQISSSKLRPKLRRQFCGLPNLVNHEVLLECGLNSLSRVEHVPDPVTPKPKAHWWSDTRFNCQTMSDSTKCVLEKMGVLNKYGFLDYFKMKDRIRMFTSKNPAWSPLTDAYLSAFTAMPMYGNQCSTPKKLLNVLDAMLQTCPVSKRRISLQCNRILTDMANTAPASPPLGRYSQIQPPFYKYSIHHMLPPSFFHPSQYKPLAAIAEKEVSTKKTDYAFGILNLEGAPKVEVIAVKPQPSKKPLTLLPVYLRMRGKGTVSLARPYPSYPPILRGGPVVPPMPAMP